eukprot:TRINITY_DN80973_c0_g1_i1.p1 TRINITY_DN80973_c0_g1~~TRINITY_DN80973_c0_g1_i1.p1  ORF type:complete len:376 (-),score=54.24 TRINITY_DN80973_c0_g1_i1:122-1135(-)
MTHAWKYLLQQAAGGVRRIPGAKARIINAGGHPEGGCRLGAKAADLHALLSGKAPVLVFRGAIPLDVCKRTAARLRAVVDTSETPEEGSSPSTSFAEWRLGVDPDAPASDYSKLGFTKTDVMIQEGIRMGPGSPAPKSYLRRAAETREFLSSEVFSPVSNPFDDISKEISKLAGMRMRLERCPESRKDFLPCVVRRMTSGGRHRDGSVHMDVLVPGTNFSINVYLDVPDESFGGGELILYPTKKGQIDRFLNRHFFETIEVQNFYPGREFYTHELLASGKIEPIVYRPSAGDVIFIDPAYPHAVRDFGGPSDFRRISLQTFVQVNKKSNQLTFEYAV